MIYSLIDEFRSIARLWQKIGGDVENTYTKGLYLIFIQLLPKNIQFMRTRFNNLIFNHPPPFMKLRLYMEQ